MINQSKQYDDYMKNAKKSKRVQSIDYDAHTGKRVHPGDELNVTKEDIRWIIGSLIIISSFMWWIL